MNTGNESVVRRDITGRDTSVKRGQTLVEEMKGKASSMRNIGRVGLDPESDSYRQTEEDMHFMNGSGLRFDSSVYERNPMNNSLYDKGDVTFSENSYFNPSSTNCLDLTKKVDSRTQQFNSLNTLKKEIKSNSSQPTTKPLSSFGERFR